MTSRSLNGSETAEETNIQLHYENLVRTMPAAIYTCDKDGRITFFNEVAVTLWGYKPDLNQDSLRFCACYKVHTLGGAYIPPAETPMALALKTGQAFRNVEAEVERPDGSRFFACVNIDPMLDTEGNVIGAINVFQDITTIKQAELALRAAESRYSQIVQNLSTPLYTTDADGYITLYNKAAVDLWGYEPVIEKDRWCGALKMYTLDGKEIQMQDRPLAIALREKKNIPSNEVLIERPDGSLRHVAPQPQLLFNDKGEVTGAINMLVDITDIRNTERDLRDNERKYRELASALEKTVEEKTSDLKRKNELLKSSEERYHKMVEEVEDYAIILMDKNGIIQNWNRGAEKIKGYKDEDIVGKSFELFYPEADRTAGVPQSLLEHARQNGKAIAEGWRVKKNGEKFWASIVITALHNEANDVIGFSKVTRDLTERKHAEDKLREYSNELEFQNKELEQFVYAASHDMKEPLRKIHLYNSYISDAVAGKIDPKSEEYLRRSVAAARRMNELIEDLLTYSRTTSNIDSFTTVDLNRIIEEIVSAHHEEVEHQHLEILHDKLPSINGVAFQCKQLFDNLINNSIKYRHPDRKCMINITCRVVRGADIVGEKAEPGRSYYMVSVIDNGIGFEPEYARKVFEIFQRLSSAHATKGSGIGLSICKKIVQNHRGYITASAKPGEGATFSVYFPIGLGTER